MKLDTFGNEELSKLQDNLIQRNKEERLSAASTTTETLSQLNITTETLPQRCQDLLEKIGGLQLSLGIEELDPVVISCRQSRELARKLELEYELMELKQKNVELDRQIERNRKVIEDLKANLQSSKESLSRQTPNPENITEHIRQMKQKLASYDDIYSKAKAKFMRLNVPEGLLPKSIDSLAQRLAALKEEEESLRMRAEDIDLARKARDTLNRLRK